MTVDTQEKFNKIKWDMRTMNVLASYDAAGRQKIVEFSDLAYKKDIFNSCVRDCNKSPIFAIFFFS